MARGVSASYPNRAAASRAAYGAANMPVCSVAPAITGTTTVGQTLTCSSGTWSKSPTFAYKWHRAGVPIAGATADTRVLAAPDGGATLTCTVVATSAGVPAVATSAATAAITP